MASARVGFPMGEHTDSPGFSEGFTLLVQAVSVVDEMVEDGVGQVGIPDGFVPFFDRQVRRATIRHRNHAWVRPRVWRRRWYALELGTVTTRGCHREFGSVVRTSCNSAA